MLFRSLAPVEAATYTSSSSAATTPASETTAPVATVVPASQKPRRSSSVSSGELLAKRRVLRLAPDVGGQKSESDFVDLDEE